MPTNIGANSSHDHLAESGHQTESGLLDSLKGIKMNQPNDKARQIEAEIGKAALEGVQKQIEAEVSLAAAGLTTASAWIDHYLLIDFGFTPNVPYEPNSIQFYSASGFLCWKRTDNASIQTLAPILACKYVNVTWDTATQESVHIYGFQPKP